MPQRSRENGRVAVGDEQTEAMKPEDVVRHSESALPTTTASARPWSINRIADASALKLDEHAVEIAMRTPVTPK